MDWLVIFVTVCLFAAFRRRSDLRKSRAKKTANRENANRSFVRSVDQQIASLRLAIKEEGWDISDDVIDNLAITAPAWPEGSRKLRSFRIRFGEGHDGVVQTFEAHIARIKRVLGMMWVFHLRAPAVRLLAGRVHKPVVEWVVIDLDANRRRKNIEGVRGQATIADEGLALVWLFPDLAQSIDYEYISAWICAGYEVHSGTGCDQWQVVPSVKRRHDAGECGGWRATICVNPGYLFDTGPIDECDKNSHGHSVPILLS